MCYFRLAGLKSTDSFNLYFVRTDYNTFDLVDAGYVLNLDDEQEKFEMKYALSREGFDVDNDCNQGCR